MRINLRCAPMLAAIAAAFGLSLPNATGAAFAISGKEPCTHTDRDTEYCPSIGLDDCTQSYRICDEGTAGSRNAICEEGGGNQSKECHNDSDCGDKNHAKNDTFCAEE